MSSNATILTVNYSLLFKKEEKLYYHAAMTKDKLRLTGRLPNANADC